MKTTIALAALALALNACGNAKDLLNAQATPAPTVAPDAEEPSETTITNTKTTIEQSKIEVKGKGKTLKGGTPTKSLYQAKAPVASYQALYLDGFADAPACEPGNKNQLIYIIEEAGFYACDGEIWQQISFPQSAAAKQAAEVEPAIAVAPTPAPTVTRVECFVPALDFFISPMGIVVTAVSMKLEIEGDSAWVFGAGMVDHVKLVDDKYSISEKTSAEGDKRVLTYDVASNSALYFYTLDGGTSTFSRELPASACKVSTL